MLKDKQTNMHLNATSKKRKTSIAIKNITHNIARIDLLYSGIIREEIGRIKLLINQKLSGYIIIMSNL